MILVDTNILIDFFNRKDSRLMKIFAEEELAICGIVVAEFIHGARNADEAETIRNVLGTLHQFDIVASDWYDIGECLFKLRKAGIKVPLSDCAIAYIAMKNDIAVFTKDNHFKLIQGVFPRLKLYKDKGETQ